MKDRCPVCGHQFDPVNPVNVCPFHNPTEAFTPDELVGEDDDYAYCI